MIPAFRLTDLRVKFEFSDIIKEFEDMDVDVISIEAASSEFLLLDFKKRIILDQR